MARRVVEKQPVKEPEVGVEQNPETPKVTLPELPPHKERIAMPDGSEIIHW